MKTIRTAVAAAALVAALAGCGATTVAGTPAPQPGPAPAPQGPPPAPSAAPDPEADQDAIEGVFNDYYQALQDQDFTKACGLSAPETTTELLTKLRDRGVDATTCEEGMTAVYASSSTARVVAQVAQTATIQDVAVRGDTATIRWSSEVNGKRSPASTKVRKVDGNWLLASSGT